MPRYLSFFFYFFIYIYVMTCFVLTSPSLMPCVYLQTFEAALFWKKKICEVYVQIVFVHEKATCSLEK